MEKRQKILYIVTKSVWGGAQRYVYDLATNLPRDRFEAVVAGGGDGMLFAKLRTAGIRTISVPGLQKDVGVASEWRAFLRIFRLLRKERPGVVHLNSSKAGILGAIAAFIFKLSNFFPIWKRTWKRGFQLGNPVSTFRPRVIFTAHGWGFHEDRSRLARTAIFFVSWFSSLFQDKIIILDTADFSAAKKFVPRRKLALIPNGIKEIDFYARADARAFLSSRIGHRIPPNAIVIGTIAELTRNKGLLYLIEAYFVLRLSLHTNYGGLASVVVVMGGGEEEEKLRAAIQKKGLQDGVFLLGFIPDAARLLTGFDVFALPSLKEGLPYAVMEAMAAGLPVIATAVGGIPDIVTHGADGFLVPPKDPQALAAALVRIVAGDARQHSAMAERARISVRTKFSFDAMMKRTISLYSYPSNAAQPLE